MPCRQRSPRSKTARTNAKKTIEHMDAHPGHPSQSEGAGGQIPKRMQRLPTDIWKSFQRTCAEFTDEHPYAVRVCDGRVGAKVSMRDAPHFDLPDRFDPTRVQFADVSGTGAAGSRYGSRSVVARTTSIRICDA